MKRHQFLHTTTTGAVACAGSLGAGIAQAQTPTLTEVTRIDHLVGICMSPLFYGHATGMSEAEDPNVYRKFVPNPGDGLAALVTSAIHKAHLPFTKLAVDVAGACPDCSPRPVAALQLPDFELLASSDTSVSATLRDRLSYGFEIDAASNATFLRLERAKVVQDAVKSSPPCP